MIQNTKKPVISCNTSDSEQYQKKVFGKLAYILKTLAWRETLNWKDYFFLTETKNECSL